MSFLLDLLVMTEKYGRFDFCFAHFPPLHIDDYLYHIFVFNIKFDQNLLHFLILKGTPP